MQKKIAIIIPTRGRADYLEKCLESIFNLDYTPIEVIIVDDGLDKKSLEMLDNFKNNIIILHSNSKGPSFARNLAAKYTNAEFLAFTDSDCIVEKNWITELLNGFSVFPYAVGCGGMQKLPYNSLNFEKKVFIFMKKSGFISDYIRSSKTDAIIEVNHNPSCNVMYRREIFLKEGGFLEGLWPGEDVELDYRLKKKNYTLVFNPKAVVYHYKPKNFKSFSKMMYRYGLSQGYLVKRYGIFRKIHIVPLLVVGVIITLTVFFFFKLYMYFLATISFLIFIFLFSFNLSILVIAIFGFLYWNIGFFSGFIRKFK